MKTLLQVSLANHHAKANFQKKNIEYQYFMLYKLVKNSSIFGKIFQNLEAKWIVLFLLAIGLKAHAQMEELKQLANAFYQANADKYDRKLYNLASRDHGKIRETAPVSTFEMLLTRKDKNPETGKRCRIYLTIYYYSDPDECRSAAEVWFKKFIRNSSIKPNRKSKITDPEAQYYILFNREYILIMDMPCYEWEKEEWNTVKKSLLKVFEESQSKALEIDCGTGTVIWSLNSF
ncbi:hypothetical protein JCM31826_16380 [Thermaurantimonas aggregans]|uniref:Uncharacterized protein n=1 Tax=Thermaurantimonas aggregans TaxID=2173829 RepID=A0A401XME0_9FLAO|nr:hypothetical protein [Thermaurantimonas aggregans]MCX8147752.1 hypothetical protein [Thermaurantimonas aggregans]GCD78156.1 hypothetical protein JCM31826_16380 [Thermaurantimonas aggregans]